MSPNVDRCMKRSVLIIAISTAANLTLVSLGFADTIHLRNGNTFEGTISASDDKQVTIDIPGAGQLTLEKAEIASIATSSPQQETTQQTLSQSEMNHVASVSQSSPAQSENRYSNPTLGISVLKPAGWRFITKQEVLDSFAPSDARSAVIKMLAKYADTPLVVMAKYKEPYDDVNPIFQVDIRPLNQLNASDTETLAKAAVGPIALLYQDVNIVQGPENVMLRGRKAGYVAFNYSMKVPDGRIFPIRGEIWTIPKTTYCFIVTAGTRPDEKTGTRGEIKDILDSLVIEN